MNFLKNSCVYVYIRIHIHMHVYGLPWWLSGKESTCQAGDAGSIPGSGRSPGEGKWQATPALLPGKSHGQMTLVGCSPWGHKSDTTQQLTHKTLSYLELVGAWECEVRSVSQAGTLQGSTLSIRLGCKNQTFSKEREQGYSCVRGPTMNEDKKIPS